jgi:TrmH family RNA methyltransferase
MITSASNPRIKAACKLRRARQRRKQGRMLMEGVRLVEDAWRAGVRPETVFYAPALVEHNQRALALLQAMDTAGVESLACSEAAFAALAETVTPQGIAAVVPLPAMGPPERPTLILLLDQVREPGNAGALLRSAEAAGADLVIFAPNTVDPFNDKAVRAGMGAHFRLPLQICRTWEQVLGLLGDIPLYLAEARADLAYDEMDWRRPAGLVVGGEADGASEEARRAATPIAIPMLGDAESLNAAVAGAVILFEAARQRRG